ncbi:MAG: hypothetical protein ACJ76Y_24900 [Thermoanaerobaculia bacterium]
MNHIINVTFDPKNQKAYIDPNPLPKPSVYIKPGDTVTWLVGGEKELQVLFLKTRILGDSSLPKDCNPMGPFSTLSVGIGLIFGTIRYDVPTAPPNQRFLYKFFYNGQEYPLANPLKGEVADFGGIDIPMTMME